MKPLLILLFALAPAWAQGPGPAPQPPVVVVPVTPPTPATPPPASLPAIPLPPVVSTEPSQFYSMGGGISGTGPVQPFGYFSTSEHISAGTYVTQAYLTYRQPGGKVGTCGLGGISKSMGQIGPITLGLVGDVG